MYRITTTRSSSLRMAWSTFQPLVKCGKAYDINKTIWIIIIIKWYPKVIPHIRIFLDIGFFSEFSSESPMIFRSGNISGWYFRSIVRFECLAEKENFPCSCMCILLKNFYWELRCIGFQRISFSGIVTQHILVQREERAWYLVAWSRRKDGRIVVKFWYSRNRIILREENSKLRGERETIMADKIRLQKLSKLFDR